MTATLATTTAETTTPETTTSRKALAHALNDALRHELDTDPKVLLVGEDIGPLGGVFRVTDGLAKDFGEDRVVTSPLGEAGIVGSAIGLALAGYRTIVEIQFDGFVFPAMNQIVTQLAKYRHRSEGNISLPVVIRIPVGGGIGAIEHHSESPEAYFAHTPGLRVLCPSTPQEGYTLLRAAVRCSDPVVFLEPKKIYWGKGEVDFDAPTADLNTARTVRRGDALTIATYGALVSTAVKAADEMARDGHEVEIVDLRTLSPLDHGTVVESVRRTGRLVITHEASQSGGIGGELATRVQREAFYDLEAPVLRVTGYDTPYPASRLEADWLPNLDRLLDACDASLSY
ncbi:alpha-ketoacid dehydrogenase subunit beta [Mycolicibacterium komossense]|uniref:Alpha-ketoacid dehydrogenase subunit beta n=1 Tax=Mycolicibacterium komossense TaxID=1779 RepID=A0ABT3CJ24_9MYCO|nr:alpha-ketoacid dehydrogenase subunit beta [Mycolicibacterium komossense]MCV7229494.1 alpha-ketoacid dehydrogenase subunit beta [Mycolicibacterium komossense]